MTPDKNDMVGAGSGRHARLIYRPMKSKDLGVDLRAGAALAVQSAKAAAVKEERKRRKYRCKSVLMDGFFCASRYAETAAGLLVGLDRVTCVTSGACVSQSVYNVMINGVPHRVESLQGATDFLNGFSAGVVFARGLALAAGAVAAGCEKTEAIMGSV